MGDARGDTFLFLLATIIGAEYFLKQQLESLPKLVEDLNTKAYWAMRTAYWIAVTGLSLVFLHPKSAAFGIGALAGLVTLLELPMTAFQGLVFKWTGSRFRPLQLLVMSGLFATAWGLSHWPGLAISTTGQWVWLRLSSFGPIQEFGLWKTLLLLTTYVFLAWPANYLVRWLVDKDEDRYVVDRLFEVQRVGVQSALEAASSSNDHHGRRLRAKRGSLRRSTLKAGRVIGILERWVVLTFILVAQFESVGLVLAAKSIARYKEIERNPAFGEYYLLGTLYSTLFAVVAGLLVRTVL